MIPLRKEITSSLLAHMREMTRRVELRDSGFVHQYGSSVAWNYSQKICVDFAVCDASETVGASKLNAAHQGQ